MNAMNLVRARRTSVWTVLLASMVMGAVSAPSRASAGPSVVNGGAAWLEVIGTFYPDGYGNQYGYAQTVIYDSCDPATNRCPGKLVNLPAGYIYSKLTLWYWNGSDAVVCVAGDMRSNARTASYASSTYDLFANCPQAHNGWAYARAEGWAYLSGAWAYTVSESGWVHMDY